MRKLVIFDRHLSGGGGQLVARTIVERLHNVMDVIVVTPDQSWLAREVRGMAQAHPPQRLADKAEDLGLARDDNVVLLANSFRDLRLTTTVTSRLSEVCAASSMALLHSYARNPAREVLIRALLRRIDVPILIEPGMARYARRAETLPVLAPNAIADELPVGFNRTNDVKTYARPDRSKGLHLFPSIVSGLDSVTAQVALGEPMESDLRYVTQLSRDLAPWLVLGPKNAGWFNPGDIFLSTSIYGETAALTVQEALQAGCMVIAPRIGAIPFLLTHNEALLIYDAGNAKDARRRVQEAMDMPELEFVARCRAGSRSINRRVGAWYEAFEDVLGIQR